MIAARAALALLAFIAAGCSTARPVPVAGGPERTYRAPYTTAVPTLEGDGVRGDGLELNGLERGAWARAPWTEDFIDIQGPALPVPAYRTRAKMLWDERNLYVAAELMEPDVWASLTEHDQIVFHDNDFEVFIDPDGDTREYYEIEVNPLGTIFDLYLHQMYRHGGPAAHGWDCAGLGIEIDVRGTLSNPADIDDRWFVQLTIPWASLQPPSADRAPEIAGKTGFGDAARAGAAPREGDEWRINFSRVQWRHNYEALNEDGSRAEQGSVATRSSSASPQSRRGSGDPYAKVPKLAEDNWVWSPQWAIDMHLPQFWGRVTFVR